MSDTDPTASAPDTHPAELPPSDAKAEIAQEPPAQSEFGPGRRLRNLDAGLEDELAAAMGGMSDKDIYGDLSRREKKPPATAGDGGRKKGKVLAVHGGDVFIHVPGGRSQGVLPLTQFPEGPPAVGSEIEVHIERYDEANGLLLLSRKGAAVHAAQVHERAELPNRTDDSCSDLSFRQLLPQPFSIFFALFFE